MNSWRRIFSRYGGHYSTCENERAFRAFTGVHPEVAEEIYRRYGNTTNATRFRIFIVLHYLRVAPSEDIGSKLFNYKTRTTYRTHLWQTVHHLHKHMNEINIENRFNGPVATYGLFKDIALVVDGTDCPIERPNKQNVSAAYQKWERRRFYSGREKENARSKYSLKYTVGVQVCNGKICFVDGPQPGSMSDLRALRESRLLAKIRTHDLDESILADKGYVCDKLANIITPIKKQKGKKLKEVDLAFNEVISSVRFVVECSLGRIKIFQILNYRFSKGSTRIKKHKKIFNLCSQITNISLEREPLSLIQQPLIY